MDKIIYFKSKFNNLPLVTCAGNVFVSAPNKHFRRTPDEYILYFIESGEMSIVEEQNTYNLLRGDIIIFDPSACHYGIERNSDIKYWYIHFTMTDLTKVQLTNTEYNHQLIANRMSAVKPDASIPNRSFIIPKKFTVNEDDIPTLLISFMEINQNYHNGNEFNDIVLGANLCELLIRLIRTNANYQMKSVPKHEQIVIELISFLKTNYKEKLSSAIIEEQFHCNFNYLNRRFKETTETTIFTFLNEYRINESKQLIRNSQYNYSEISDLLGFCNEFYFSRVFKKYVGMSPSEYKRRTHEQIKT